MKSELIRIENHGRHTELYIAGLKFGEALYGLSFDQSGENLSSPKITVTVDIREMLQVLSEITPEQLESAKEIIKPYLDGYKRTVTDDGNSSIEILR
ncbi:MAG: hypothetical protein Q4E86_07625 [Lachnospiraceae bacterium]|nr:hypothetical protein [Lachnospiraceae bacterium]